MENKPRILVLLPANYSLHEMIAYNLDQLGYDATVLHHDSFPFRYKNWQQKVQNFIAKTIKGDKSFKQKLRDESIFEAMKTKVNEYAAYDHILVMRADFFSQRLLNYLRTKTKDFVSYHFDGINRYPAIFDRISLFDRFYVFDSDDKNQYPEYNFKPATNFYFNYIPSTNEKKKQKAVDFYFLASYHESRTKALLDFAQFAENHGLSHHFEIIYSSTNPPTQDLQKKFFCHTDYIGFSEYLHKIQNSRYILDLLISEHKGLSFRVFESLQFEKKLITSNPTVKMYDFYHPDNIFVLEDNYDKLQEFLQKPYVKLNSELVEKYSLSNWLKYIFETPPFNPISLP